MWKTSHWPFMKWKVRTKEIGSLLISQSFLILFYKNLPKLSWNCPKMIRLGSPVWYFACCFLSPSFVTLAVCSQSLWCYYWRHSGLFQAGSKAEQGSRWVNLVETWARFKVQNWRQTLKFKLIDHQPLTWTAWDPQPPPRTHTQNHGLTQCLLIRESNPNLHDDRQPILLY